MKKIALFGLLLCLCGCTTVSCKLHEVDICENSYEKFYITFASPYGFNKKLKSYFDDGTYRYKGDKIHVMVDAKISSRRKKDDFDEIKALVVLCSLGLFPVYDDYILNVDVSCRVYDPNTHKYLDDLDIAFADEIEVRRYFALFPFIVYPMALVVDYGGTGVDERIEYDKHVVRYCAQEVAALLKNKLSDLYKKVKRRQAINRFQQNPELCYIKDGIVAIPEGVTNIYDNVFCGDVHLKSVIIPKSVTRIGRRAFKDCVNLRAITIPNGVTAIDESAFEGCNSLTSIVLPPSVTKIGASAFANCDTLASVKLLSNATDVGVGAFRRCPELNMITTPNGAAMAGNVDELLLLAKSKTSALRVFAVDKIAQLIKDGMFDIDDEGKVCRCIMHEEFDAALAATILQDAKRETLLCVVENLLKQDKKRLLFDILRKLDRSVSEWLTHQKLPNEIAEFLYSLLPDEKAIALSIEQNRLYFPHKEMPLSNFCLMGSPFYPIRGAVYSNLHGVPLEIVSRRSNYVAVRIMGCYENTFRTIFIIPMRCDYIIGNWLRPSDYVYVGTDDNGMMVFVEYADDVARKFLLKSLMMIQ